MWTTSQISFRPISTRCRRWSPRRARSATLRSQSAALRWPRATMRCRRWIGCATSCGSCNAQFGRRSEKLDPEQLLLAIEDIEQTLAGDDAAEDGKDAAGARKRADKRHADRGALPAPLRHIDVTIAPEDNSCPCCRAPMHVIGEETSKRLDVVPAQFRMIVTHRPKCACHRLLYRQA